MREILFRGKRIDNGEWVEGGFVQGVKHELWQNENRAFIVEFPRFLSSIKLIEVEPETVGQYTGLEDKNGKQIFEGDILRFSYTGKNKGVDGTAAVVFQDGKFGVLWGWHKEFVALDGFANTSIEVIGNLHDNPELLDV